MCIWSENSSAKSQWVVEGFGSENEMIVERGGWESKAIDGVRWVVEQFLAHLIEVVNGRIKVQYSVFLRVAPNGVQTLIETLSNQWT
jgi:hypothetical protein